eukprot:g40294.t1
MLGKWEAFKMTMRVQRQYVPVGEMGKVGRCRECWMTGELEVVLKKKEEVYVRYRQQRSSELLEEYKGSRSILQREIGNTKRRHEVALTNGMKENPKRFYRGMVSKFVDDIKIDGVVDSEEDYPRIQRDLDQMGQSAEEWQMELNLEKCEKLGGHVVAIQGIGEDPSRMLCTYVNGHAKKHYEDAQINSNNIKKSEKHEKEKLQHAVCMDCSSYSTF